MNQIYIIMQSENSYSFILDDKELGCLARYLSDGSIKWLGFTGKQRYMSDRPIKINKSQIEAIEGM